MLLATLQAAKSKGERAKQDDLFDGLVVDRTLRKEIAERRQGLDLATQRVVVYPRLVLVRDDRGNVIDVTARSDEDLKRQQLRFSEVNKSGGP